MVGTSKRGRSRSTVHKPTKSQIQAVNEGLNHLPIFWDLPNAGDYAFEDVRFADANTPLAQTTHQKQLFLGEDAAHRCWARLKTYPSPNKASEVDLLAETKPRGEIHVVTTVENLANLALQYPFRVYQSSFKENPVKDLKTFVMYVYLDAGLVQSVFPANGLASVVRQLQAGMNLIKKEYDKQGGVENIPQMTRPSDQVLKTNSVAHSAESSEGEKDTIVVRPYARVRHRTHLPSQAPSSASFQSVQNILIATNNLARLSVEPSVEPAAEPSNRKGKRKADPLQDLEDAKRLRQKQNEEDNYIVRMKEQLRVLAERKKAREAQINHKMQGKGPDDFQAYFESSLRPRLSLEGIGEEDEEAEDNLEVLNGGR